MSVYWPLDDAWYPGIVRQYNLLTKKHFVLYDDGGKEWVPLAEDMWMECEDSREVDYSNITLDPQVHADPDAAEYNCWECGQTGSLELAQLAWGVDPDEKMVECQRCAKACHRRYVMLFRIVTTPSVLSQPSAPAPLPHPIYPHHICTHARTYRCVTLAWKATQAKDTKEKNDESQAAMRGEGEEDDEKSKDEGATKAGPDFSRVRCKECTACETCGEIGASSLPLLVPCTQNSRPMHPCRWRGDGYVRRVQVPSSRWMCVPGDGQAPPRRNGGVDVQLLCRVPVLWHESRLGGESAQAHRAGR